VLSPFNAYLQMVGLETLSQRVRQEVATAKLIAEHLRGVDHVVRINYSGLDDDRQRELATQYLPQGVGTVLSFEVEGDESHVSRIVNGVRVFSYVPNIGDSRSLIVNPARITHREVPKRYRQAAGVNDNLLRLSIGLENHADLIADLDQAIAGAY
jgi:O-acetylhomoserine (thiol)-lyase